MAASIKVYMKEEKEKKIKGIPQVPTELSAKLVKEDGSNTIFFIDKDYGIKMGLMSKMDFKITHPSKPNLCEIKIPIERV